MDEMDPISSQPEPEGPRDDNFHEARAECVDEARQDGWMRFFSFDTLYFPVFAHYIFIVFVVSVLLVGLGGIVAAFTLMARVGFSDGMYGLLQSVATVAVLLVGGRLWLELAMVVFKINEALQDIRRHTSKLK